MPRFGPGFFGKPAAHIDLGFQLFGWWNFGHLGIQVMKPLFVPLKTGS